MAELKAELISLKVESLELGAERAELGERAGMVANTALLGDYKITEGEGDRAVGDNMKLSRQIRHFYDFS